MSTSNFTVLEHLIPCQYLREYQHGATSDNAPLRLAIKEYRPLDEKPDSLTIIAVPGIGFVKEAYEPLFDDLYQALRGKIRGIWIADCYNQGTSGVINEDLLGDDPNWFDHSRDLLYMVNQFRDRMPRPIIGLGYSFGAAQLVDLSQMHPRLFHSLALIEPIIQPQTPQDPCPALPSTFRKDTWSSRTEAESFFRQKKAYSKWDPRALNLYLTHGLRQLNPPQSTPSTTNNKDTTKSVTLTTSKHQEAWTYVRSNFKPVSEDPAHERLLAPDLNTENAKHLFNRPEIALTSQTLPSVRPNVLYLFGTASYINASEASRTEKVSRTGTGIGGGGGAAAGRVESLSIEGSSHMIPFENPRECARALAPWVKRQMQDFREVERFLDEHRSRRSVDGMKRVSKLFEEKV